MKKTNSNFWLVLGICIILSIFIGWMDSHPRWDDTGITVCAILLSAFLLGVFGGGHPWLWAVILGSGVFLFNAVLHQTYAPAFAFVFSFAGAYAGFFFKRFFRKTAI